MVVKLMIRKAKYVLISEQIEKAIANGVYQDQLPGLYKLAEDYNTTHITVSKALRLLEEKGLVSVNATRGTFISEKSNFRKNRVICIVGFSAYNRLELDAIEKVASEFRYHVVSLASNPSLNDLLYKSPDFLTKFPADGYIFAQSVLTSKLATELRRNGISFISLNQINEPVGISWVDYNAEANLLNILKKAKSYGHNRIAYIEFTNNHYQYSKRMREVYHDFMYSSGVFNGKYFFSPGSHDEYYQDYGNNYWTHFADDAVEWLLSFDQRPTVIIVQVDIVADMIIKKLKKNGISVPKDMSIIAYSDYECRDYLARMHVDCVKRATEASRILLNQIKYQKCSVVQKFISSKFIEAPSLTCAPEDKITKAEDIRKEIFV